MIDQAARPEFRDGQETRALEERASLSFSRNEGVERQPREVVAGQEALGREIAVGVEVRAVRGLALFENGDLVARLHLRSFDSATVRARKTGDLGAGVGLHQLRSGGVVEFPPTIEGAIELLRRALGDLGDELIRLTHPDRFPAIH